MFLIAESAVILHFFEKNNKKQKNMHFSRKKKQNCIKRKKNMFKSQPCIFEIPFGTPCII